jgi:hypothetical protein
MCKHTAAGLATPAISWCYNESHTIVQTLLNCNNSSKMQQDSNHDVTLISATLHLPLFPCCAAGKILPQAVCGLLL